LFSNCLWHISYRTGNYQSQHVEIRNSETSAIEQGIINRNMYKFKIAKLQLYNRELSIATWTIPYRL
jgi:L-rhamnose isomerase